jgi:hypothetical protein
VGQYVNGDYFVVDEGSGVDIVDIDPASGDDGTSRIINGSMVNPITGSPAQSYDSAASGYDGAFNVALGVSAGSPLSLTGLSSLMSTVSLLSSHPSYSKTRIGDAAVLTVVSSVPAVNSFRPAYCGTSKKLFTEEDLDYSGLVSLPFPASAPTLSTVEGWFDMVFLDHAPWASGSQIHPINGWPWYGEDISARLEQASLYLHGNLTNDQKRDLMIGFVQLGIDQYGIVSTGARYGSDGGHMGGRFWPLIFTGIVLNDADILNRSNWGGNNHPENAQTFYVSQTEVDATNGPSWDPDSRAPTAPYTSAMIGMPEWGINHDDDIFQDNADWRAIYRQCCTQVSRSGFALAALIMGKKAEWDNDAFFDYADRYMAITNGDPDPFGYTVPGETAGFRGSSAFVQDMWDTYRGNY